MPFLQKLPWWAYLSFVALTGRWVVVFIRPNEPRLYLSRPVFRIRPGGDTHRVMITMRGSAGWARRKALQHEGMPHRLTTEEIRGCFEYRS